MPSAGAVFELEQALGWADLIEAITAVTRYPKDELKKDINMSR